MVPAIGVNGETVSDDPARRAGAWPARLLCWFALGVILLGGALIRARLLDLPLERDEGEYAYAGQLFLAGVAPYEAVYTQKLPGAHVAYALSMALFGQTVRGVRLGVLVATSATCLGVFLLGRRFFAVPAAISGAAAYAAFSLSTEMLGPYGHATHFVALFAVWGLVALDRALTQGGTALYLLTGSLLGVAVLMKQHGAVFLACAIVWIAVARPERWLRRIGTLLFGSALALALLLLWLGLTGSVPRFWYWVVRYGTSYGTLQTLREGWGNFTYTTSRFLPQAALLWLLAACGALILLTNRHTRSARWQLGAFAMLSFLGVCPGLYFRDHYFLLFLPAAALLVGVAATALASVPRLGRILVPMSLLLASGQALWSQREILFHASPESVSRLLYGADLLPESLEIGRYLRGHMKPDDTLVVFGSEPQIPFYARRRSATGFVFVYPLMQVHPDTRRMQESMIREVETARPAYAVLVKVSQSWLEQPDSDHYMQDWAVRYLDQHYALAGQVLVTDRGSRYLWDEAALGYPIGEETQALVMRRRDLAAAR